MPGWDRWHRVEIAATIVHTLGSLALLGVLVFFVVRAVNRIEPETTAVLHNLNDASYNIAAYVAEQKKTAEEPRNRAALESSYLIPAETLKTIHRVRKVTLPKLDQELDALHATTLDLQSATGAIAGLVAHTDTSLNGGSGVFPNLSKLLTSLGVTVGQFNATITMLHDKGGMTFDDIHRVLTDPDFFEAVKSVKQAMANVAKGSEKIPSIAEALNKLANTTSKWQRAIIVATIFELVGRGFGL